MPVRQLKLRFDNRPTTRVVPSLLMPKQGPRGVEKGNQKASGATAAEPMLGVASHPSPAGPEASPPPGNG